MKRFFSTIVLLAACYAAGAQAPVYTMDVPFSNFESWTEYSGDTLSLLGMPIPLRESYTVPEGWAVPVLSVDETLSYSGLDIPIALDLPLSNLSRDTMHAPQGHSALIAETFTLSSLLTPMAYQLAESFLDTSLTLQVLPSIAATAEIDLMKLVPLIERVLNQQSDMDWMLYMLDSVDINDYFRGGFPLNGFEPKMLHGYYKYYNANLSTTPDNAAVVAFGTRYDTIEHRRVLVGAGSKMLYELYDTVNYEPFHMDYTSLNDYFPSGYEFSVADTMVVMVVSSASEKFRTEGSKLYIDSLWLEEIDGSCGRVYNVRNVSPYYTSARIAWNNTVVPDRWETEYGLKGFIQGRGTRATVTDSVLDISGLRPGTEYDFYVRSMCGDTANSSWGYVCFRTDSIPEGISDVELSRVKVMPNPCDGRCVVDFGGLQVQRVRLYAMDGRMLQDVAARGSQMEFSLPQKGVYVVEMLCVDGRTARSKAIRN